MTTISMSRTDAVKIEAEARGLKPCRFYFGDDPTWDGFTDGTTWNGFDNVWVTPEVHAAICKHFTADFRKSGYHGADLLDAMESFLIEPDDDGLYSYAGGFATSIDEGDDQYTGEGYENDGTIPNNPGAAIGPVGVKSDDLLLTAIIPDPDRIDGNSRKELYGNTPDELVKAVRAWITETGYGASAIGANFSVYQDGKYVAGVAYNGRFDWL